MERNAFIIVITSVPVTIEVNKHIRFIVNVSRVHLRHQAPWQKSSVVFYPIYFSQKYSVYISSTQNCEKKLPLQYGRNSDICLSTHSKNPLKSLACTELLIGLLNNSQLYLFYIFIYSDLEVSLKNIQYMFFWSFKKSRINFCFQYLDLKLNEACKMY